MTFWKTLWQNNINVFIEQNKALGHESDIFVTELSYNKQKISIFLSYDKSVDLHELEKLCDTVGWVRRPLRKVKIAIENSFLTVSLFYKKASESKLIAFARTTSDNTFNATIWDVVVHPDFQRKGLGKILIHETIKKLRYYEINTITLFADPQVTNFYRNLGFVSDPDGVKGMFWYPKT